MKLDERLELLREYAGKHCRALTGNTPKYILIFSASDGKERAQVRHVCADSFEDAWRMGVSRIRGRMQKQKLAGRHLRVDWVESSNPYGVEKFKELIAAVKRTYFRFGFALDESHTHLFTEMECHANAIFYGGHNVPVGHFNEANFARYARERFGSDVALPDAPDGKIWILATAGAYLGPDDELHPLPGLLPSKYGLMTRGLYTGHRAIPRLSPDLLRKAVGSGSRWLARQIRPDGKFVYGYFPCFGREIAAYNSLRHASSVYSLLDAMDFTGDRSFLEDARRSLKFMAERLIREYEPEPGRRMAFLVDDTAGEIKLGANGAALFACAKYWEISGSSEFASLMALLAEGVAYMQDPDSGAYTHVLDSKTLAVKDVFRIIYYDGEAVLGLLRLYALDKNPRWLELARKAFERFLVSEEHAKAHDHWLSYAANEISAHIPDERYFRFGINNCMPYLNFILHRETAYPTLLELVMAAQKMFMRAKELKLDHLLEQVDMDKFRQAMHYRANYLLNGFFWPEMAMFFHCPDQVAGSFFIRHQAFRTRIDDTQHYLSGLAAYGAMLERGEPFWAAPDNARSMGTRFKRVEE